MAVISDNSTCASQGTPLGGSGAPLRSFGLDLHHRARVARTDLVVDSVEDRGHDLDRGISERLAQRAAAVGEVALEEELSRARAQAWVLTEARGVRHPLLVSAPERLRRPRVVGNLQERSRHARGS